MRTIPILLLTGYLGTGKTIPALADFLPGDLLVARDEIEQASPRI